MYCTIEGESMWYERFPVSVELKETVGEAAPLPVQWVVQRVCRVIHDASTATEPTIILLLTLMDLSFLKI